MKVDCRTAPTSIAVKKVAHYTVLLLVDKVYIPRWCNKIQLHQRESDFIHRTLKCFDLYWNWCDLFEIQKSIHEFQKSMYTEILKSMQMLVKKAILSYYCHKIPQLCHEFFSKNGKLFIWGLFVSLKYALHFLVFLVNDWFWNPTKEFCKHPHDL